MFHLANKIKDLHHICQWRCSSCPWEICPDILFIWWVSLVFQQFQNGDWNRTTMVCGPQLLVGSTKAQEAEEGESTIMLVFTGFWFFFMYTHTHRLFLEDNVTSFLLVPWKGWIKWAISYLFFSSERNILQTAGGTKSEFLMWTTSFRHDHFITIGVLAFLLRHWDYSTLSQTDTWSSWL